MTTEEIKAAINGISDLPKTHGLGFQERITLNEERHDLRKMLANQENRIATGKMSERDRKARYGNTVS